MFSAAFHDNTIRVWSLEDGDLLFNTTVQDRGITGLWFFMNEKRIAATVKTKPDWRNVDSLLRAWDIATGKEVTAAYQNSIMGLGDNLFDSRNHHRRRVIYSRGNRQLEIQGKLKLSDLAWLPEFWLTVVLGGVSMWSVWRDQKTMTAR